MTDIDAIHRAIDALNALTLDDIDHADEDDLREFSELAWHWQKLAEAEADERDKEK